ncbi:MAG: hypothetical protein QNJ98_11785 [Planctomycetota bacterium]|nr:hypothetical protein [Planctomycetota bacterium]
MTRLAATVAVLALVVPVSGCQGVSPTQLASMPAQTYHIEYYMITPK